MGRITAAAPTLSRQTLFLGAALLVSGSAHATSAGAKADQACAYLWTGGGELMAVKVGAAEWGPTDVLFDPRAKGEPASDSQSIDDPSGPWSIGHPWRVARVAPDVTFVVITHAAGYLHLDSSDQTTIDWGVTPLMRVGDSMPAGVDAGIGLAIPGTRTTYRAGPHVAGEFPERMPDGSVRLAFAPLVEVNDLWMGAEGCSLGGAATDPSDPAPNDVPPVAGRIIGYNVYRMPACARNAGSAEEFAATLFDGDARTGWVGFVDLRHFYLSVADDGSVIPGANDLAPLDAAQLSNRDGRMYSGDEVLFFTDRAAADRPDPWRAPRPDQSYWYAVQPVWRGALDEFADVGFTINDVFPGDHRRDLDGNGAWDSVDLHSGATTPEFVSPQAEPGNGGLDGLGLTHRGMPLLSAPMFAAPADPAALNPECIVISRPRVPIGPRPLRLSRP